MKFVCCSHTNSFGGAELAFCEMLQCLSSRGEVHVTVPDTVGDLKSHLHSVGIYHVSAHRWPMWMQTDFTFKRRIKCFLRIWTALKEGLSFFRQERPDVVIVNTISSPVPLLVAKWLHIPTMVFVHENGGFGVYRFLFGEQLTKRLIGKVSTRVLCNSKYICNEYAKYIVPDKLIVVYQPVVIAPAAKKEHNIFTIGCVGILSPQKNFKFLLTALKGVEDVKLCVAGFDGNEYGAQMKSYCSKEGIADRVEWLGRVDDMATYYASIDMLVACGKQEALGRSVIEAMKCRVPVIVSNEGGYNELVEDGKTGFVFEADNKMAFLQTIERVRSCTDTELNCITSSAYDFACRMFSKEKFLREIITQINMLPI